MDLEERVKKYKKSFFFRTNENFKYFFEKYRELEIPLVLAGCSASILTSKVPKFDSKIMEEEHFIAISTLILMPFLLFSSGFFGNESYLKNFSKNKLIPFIGFSVGFSSNYYSNFHSNNVGEFAGFFNSALVGGISYYFLETLRTIMLSSNQNFFNFFNLFSKKEENIQSLEFEKKVSVYESKKELLSLISEIFSFDEPDGGIVESVGRFTNRIGSINKTGNVLTSFKIKQFHSEKNYSKLFSEIDNLEGFEPGELMLVKAYYVSKLYDQKKVNLKEFMKFGKNPKLNFWKSVWNEGDNLNFKNLGGKDVYEVSKEFSEFLQQQIVFKKGDVKKELNLLKQSKNIFSRYSEFDVVTVNYECEQGIILGRELGVEGWDLEDKEVLKSYGKGIALLQNNMNDEIEGGLVLDLDCHPGNIYFGKQLIFADLRGKDYREAVIDIVKATQVKGRSEYLIEGWLNQRGHERTYGKEILMEMINFPENCKRKILRGKQGSDEIAQRRYEKSEWARNQLGLERRIY